MTTIQKVKDQHKLIKQQHKQNEINRKQQERQLLITTEQTRVNILKQMRVKLQDGKLVQVWFQTLIMDFLNDPSKVQLIIDQIHKYGGNVFNLFKVEIECHERTRWNDCQLPKEPILGINWNILYEYLDQHRQIHLILDSNSPLMGSALILCSYNQRLSNQSVFGRSYHQRDVKGIEFVIDCRQNYTHVSQVSNLDDNGCCTLM